MFLFFPFFSAVFILRDVGGRHVLAPLSFFFIYIFFESVLNVFAGWHRSPVVLHSPLLVLLFIQNFYISSLGSCF